MQTGVTAQRQNSAAHSTNRQVYLGTGQIIVDDQRIRGWTLASDGGMTALTPPTIASAASASGAGLSANVWYYAVMTRVSGNVESYRSNEVSARTTGVRKRVTLYFNSATAAWESFNVYVNTAAGIYTYQNRCATGITGA